VHGGLQGKGLGDCLEFGRDILYIPICGINRKLCVLRCAVRVRVLVPPAPICEHPRLLHGKYCIVGIDYLTRSHLFGLIHSYALYLTFEVDEGDTVLRLERNLNQIYGYLKPRPTLPISRCEHMRPRSISYLSQHCQSLTVFANQFPARRVPKCPIAKGT
jgi:hypothetical protein